MPMHERWKEVVCHWQDGALELNLHIPLKDWPREYLHGCNRGNQSKWNQQCHIMDRISRSVSASSLLSRHTDSHIPTLRYGGDEAAFTAAYDVTTITALLKGVKAARTE